MVHTAFYNSPVGCLKISEENGKIIELSFSDEKNCDIIEETEIIRLAKNQLNEYFAGKRKEFDISCELRGTDFQKRVWEALLTVPYGRTASYKDIAAASGSPKGFRAVGMANHNNPISIIYPCHRVVGSDGSLTGYGGGLDKKQYLLELEKKNGGIDNA